MPQLNPEFYTSQLFWLIVVFAFLFGVLTSYTLPKIRSFIRKRDDYINNHLSQTDEMFNKAEAMLKNYEDKINAAKIEAGNIIEKAKKEAQEIADKKIKESDLLSVERTKEAEAKIKEQTTTALKEIGKELETDAKLFISKITGKNQNEIQL